MKHLILIIFIHLLYSTISLSHSVTSFTTSPFLPFSITKKTVMDPIGYPE